MRRHVRRQGALRGPRRRAVTRRVGAALAPLRSLLRTPTLCLARLHHVLRPHLHRRGFFHPICHTCG
eukprot:2721991-Pleurochrysis_carterae.AAC.1